MLGSYACVAGTAQLTGFLPQKLALSPLTGDQGNPQFKNGRLFFDDEYTSTPPRILVADATGALPGASLSAWGAVPVGTSSDDQRQPFFDPPSTLYYSRNFTIVSAQLAGDPTQAASWTTPALELAAESGTTRAGAAVVVGQATVAHLADASTEIYFVYGLLTATGYNLNIGRIRHR